MNLAEALAPAKTTAEKRQERFLSGLRLRQDDGPVVVPGLDVAGLNAKLGMDCAHWPQAQWGSFRVPKDLARRQDGTRLFYGLAKRGIQRFLKFWQSQGYEFVRLTADEYGWLAKRQRDVYWTGPRGIEIIPGNDPAFDLGDGGQRQALPDQREFLIVANFRFPNPQPMRIELDPVLVDPVVIPRGRAAA